MTRATRIKFCGLQTAEHVDLAARLGASFVGLVVLAPKSPRDLTTRSARSLAQRVPSALKTVLVTPSENDQAILGAVEGIGPDVVQLTGNVRPRLMDELTKRRGLKVWRTFALTGDDERDLLRARQLAREAEAVVLDAKTGYGGTGQPVDWERAGKLNAALGHPLILAGGLAPQNVGDAVRRVRPWCVDVSSGIETNGNKDGEKMRAFARAVMEVPA